MKKWLCFILAICLAAFITGCGAKLPDKLELTFAAAKGYEGAAKGTTVIDTKTGTDVSINISGLEPGEVYTAFFVNIKSKMFQGVGQEPHVLPVDANGTVKFDGKIEKNMYKRYINLAIYFNPDKKPVANPVGVKAKLGAILKTKKAKMVLIAKLR